MLPFTRQPLTFAVALAVMPVAIPAQALESKPSAISPGSLALLAIDRIGPREVETLILALGSSDAPIRTAAARVAFVGNVQGAVPALVDALKGETDPDAAREQKRALGRLSPDSPEVTLAPPSPGAEAVAHASLPFIVSTSVRWAPGPDFMGRIMAVFPAYLVESVLAVTGCDGGGSGLAIEEIEYDQSDTVRRGRLEMLGLSGACKKAARALSAMAMVEALRPSGPKRRSFLKIPLSVDSIRCLAESPPGRASRSPKDDVFANGEVRVPGPKRLKGVLPVYPDSARQSRRSANIVLGVVIGPCGCIQWVEVLRGATPDLEFAAVRAVAQWQYSPTLFNGVPAAVGTTASVSFHTS